MQDHEQLLLAYEAGVQDAEISGMEHLDMLLTRSALAEVAAQLTDGQTNRLGKADKILATYAVHFYAAIARIADLKSWREQENVPPEHWWWYLDVLAVVPVVATEKVVIRPRPRSFTETLRGLHQEVWGEVDVDEWLNQERSAWA